MPDEVLNIRVTEAELDLITLLLEQAGSMEDSSGQPAFELLHDLMEQAARPDEWSNPEDPDLLMDPVDFAAKHDTGVNHDLHIAETQMFNAGVDAREKMKATSRAAGRRALKFVPPGPLGAKADRPAPQPKERSEAQEHDLWEKPSNDPVDW